MKFSLEVGDVEKHRIDFQFNQIWGKLTIQVDGDVVLSDVIFFRTSLVMNYAFDVPGPEKLSVRIQQIGAPVFAGFFPYTYNVFVDGKLAKSIRGY